MINNNPKYFNVMVDQNRPKFVVKLAYLNLKILENEFTWQFQATLSKTAQIIFEKGGGEGYLRG